MNIPFNTLVLRTRQNTIDSLKRRIISGQSTALVGEAHSGKSALCHFLVSEAMREELEAIGNIKYVVVYIDSQNISHSDTILNFWQHIVLVTQNEVNIKDELYKKLVERFLSTKKPNNMATELGKILEIQKLNNYCLVLVIDEFDYLLHHENLNRSEFFGGLRSQSQNPRTSLVVITSTRLSVSELNIQTQHMNPTGSPYFNTFRTVVVKSLSKKIVDEWLSDDSLQIQHAHREIIWALAAGQPHLTHLLLNTILEFEDELAEDKYYTIIALEVADDVDAHYSDIWRMMNGYEKAALLMQCTMEMSQLMKLPLQSDLKLLVNKFRADITKLEIRNFVRKIEDNYKIQQGAFQWWLTTKIITKLRDFDTAKEWMHVIEIDNIISINDLEILLRYAQELKHTIVDSSNAYRLIIHYALYGEEIPKFLVESSISSATSLGQVVIQPVWGLPLFDDMYKYDVLVLSSTGKKNSLYENYIQPIVEKQGLSIAKSNDIFSQKIAAKINWSTIFHAKFIIADLTDRDPDVFYKLGICHTLGKPVIMLSQNPDDVPFDLRQFNIIYFQQDESGHEFEQKLKKALEAANRFISVHDINLIGNYVYAMPIWDIPSANQQLLSHAFMVMPFSENLTTIYKNRVVKLLQSMDIDVKRGDDFFTEHTIMSEIWASIFNCNFVIADCTGKNPNVFYEIGMAHTLGKPVILITQEDMPRSIQTYRYLKYYNNPKGLIELEKSLLDAVEKLTEKKK
ncbi:MAG: hypothetical protein Crog4KO_35700 [Crocinitomicaceae bacterium]